MVRSRYRRMACTSSTVLSLPWSAAVLSKQKPTKLFGTQKASHHSSLAPLQTPKTPGSPPAAPRSAGVGLCRWATRWPTRSAPRLAAAAPRRPFFPVPAPGAPCPAARRSWPPGTKNSTARRRKNGKDYSVYSNSPKHFVYLWFFPFLFSCSCPMEPYLRIQSHQSYNH